MFNIIIAFPNTFLLKHPFTRTFKKYYFNTINIFDIYAKKLRRPGFEPGSTAWKATILTTRLTSHYKSISLSNFFTFHFFEL